MIKGLLIRFMVTICFGCVSFLQIHAQTYYDQQWKKIEDNSKKGIYKNNLSLIKNIQSQAMKDKNVEQIVKSLKAEFKILNTIEDDSKNDSASKIFTKIKSTHQQLKGDDLFIKKIDKSLATVTVIKPQGGIAQGGVFWQYYEDMDKVKSSEYYIFITKELYKKVKTENGEKLQKISASAPLKIRDKVTVRMILNADRNMEFAHLKDMHAAGFEPVDVISRYQWENNLGYYQSTKDASTNSYIETLPKGKYVFGNDYICNITGKFSNGIATL